jgi:hypothetical protein
MTPQKRFKTSVLIGAISAFLIVWPFFPQASWIGVGLSFLYFTIRGPFHSKNRNDYPKWMGYITSTLLLSYIALFLVPMEFRFLVRGVMLMGLIAFFAAFVYLDYLLVYHNFRFSNSVLVQDKAEEKKVG